MNLRRLPPTRVLPRRVYAADVVRSPRLWFEMAEVLQEQASHMEQIGEAIRNNDFDGMRRAIQKLARLVKSKQGVLIKLAPAMNELMAEVFEGEE